MSGNAQRSRRFLIALLLTLASAATILLASPPAAAVTAPAEAASAPVVAALTGSPPPALTLNTAATLTRAQKIEILVWYAFRQRGDAYCWGGTGPYCWDCSGLVMMAYRQVGRWLPHYSGSMLRYGRKVYRSQLWRGDVIWPHWGHVQLYLGNGYIVEAANYRTGVVVRKMWGFWTARRMI